MPLAHEAGGTPFHPGGKRWTAKTDPEWKELSQWVTAAITLTRAARPDHRAGAWRRSRAAS